MTGTEPDFPFPDPQQAGPGEELCAPDGRFLRTVVLGNSAQARLVCGYDELRVLLTGDSFSRARAATHGMTSRSPESLALNGADPPDHARRRGTVAAAFTRARAEKERPWIRQTAADLLGTMAGLGPPADLIAAFSLPLSVAVICRVMGVPAADFPVFSPMFDVMMSTQGYTPPEVQAAHQGIFDYFSRLYDRERARPAALAVPAAPAAPSGVLAALVIAAERDGTVTRTEAVHIAYGLLVAGYETTSKQIATTVLLLLSDRSRWDRLRRDRSGLGPAIEETLRCTSLLATGGVPHVAVGDATLGRERVQAGQVLIPVFAAANRDPRAFADPDRLSLNRAGPAHVAFGYGRHLCLGAALARVELTEALDALLSGLPGLELAGPERELRWREGAFIRGLTTLPVRW
jgi:cytochrome P450